MSNWIKVTNLPYYYDEKEAMSMFGEIGPIKRVEIEHIDVLLKTTALVQFLNPRNARLAATKKDQTVFADSIIRVRVVWCRKETLTTIKVSNLPSNITDHELCDYFAPYGEIVDIDFTEMPLSSMQQDEMCDVNGDEVVTPNNNNPNHNNQVVAWISFSRVDYALRACHEMHHSIINGSGDDSGLCVSLVNPDSRNLKWKRNLFEYVRCSMPSKRTKSMKNHTSNNLNIDNSRSNKNNKPPFISSSMIDNTTTGTRSPPSSVSPTLLKTHINTTSSPTGWIPSMRGTHTNTETLNVPKSVSGTSNATPVSYLNDNRFNNGSANQKESFSGMAPSVNWDYLLNRNNVNLSNNVMSELNIPNLCLLQSNTYLQQSPGMFAQQPQHNNSTPNSLSSSSVRSENIMALGNTTPSSLNSSLLTPNGNPFLLFPQQKYGNGGFASPVSSISSSNTTPLLSHGFPRISTPQLLANSPNSSFMIPTLQQTPVQVGNSNANFSLSPNPIQSSCVPTYESLNSIATNPIQTLPNIPIAGKLTSVPSLSSSTSVSNQSLGNFSVTSSTDSSSNGVKTIATDSSSFTSPRKTTDSISTSSSDTSASPSVWSDKQRKIGDFIYRELKSEFPERVAKLTGMLLSLPKGELDRLLADKCKLNARARQFVQLLDKDKGPL